MFLTMELLTTSQMSITPSHASAQLPFGLVQAGEPTFGRFLHVLVVRHWEAVSAMPALSKYSANVDDVDDVGSPISFFVIRSATPRTTTPWISSFRTAP